MEKDISINGLRIHYEETGNPAGAPVVIMHGWGCDHTTVRSVAAILENGMRVVNVDLPGHGKVRSRQMCGGLKISHALWKIL